MPALSASPALPALSALTVLSILSVFSCIGLCCLVFYHISPYYAILNIMSAAIFSFLTISGTSLPTLANTGAGGHKKLKSDYWAFEH